MNEIPQNLLEALGLDYDWETENECVCDQSQISPLEESAGNPQAMFSDQRQGELQTLVGWLVVLGLTALRNSISVYIEPSPKEREKEERKDRGSPPAPTVRAVGPCPTISKL